MKKKKELKAKKEKKGTRTKKRVIVTGAGGLVGMNLLSKIDLKRHEVIALDCNSNNMRLAERIFPGVRCEVADVSKDGDWKKLFTGADIIVQLQAQIASPRREPYVKNNIESVRQVLDACRKEKIKHLIHLSSSVVISVAKDHYTETKRAGEELVKRSRVPHTILRPPLMYGCFDIKHLGFMGDLIDKSPIFPVPGNGEYMRQPLFVEDMCDVIISVMGRKPDNKVHDVIGKERINFIDLVKTIARHKKKRRVFVRIPVPVFILLLKMHGLLTGKKPFVPEQLAALTAGDDFPVSEWEKEFNVKYTPFVEGVKKTLASPYYMYRTEMRKNEE